MSSQALTGGGGGGGGGRGGRGQQQTRWKYGARLISPPWRGVKGSERPEAGPPRQILGNPIEKSVEQTGQTSTVSSRCLLQCPMPWFATQSGGLLC